VEYFLPGGLRRPARPAAVVEGLVKILDPSISNSDDNVGTSLSFIPPNCSETSHKEQLHPISGLNNKIHP
jgi:hypothetical protein